MGAGEIFQGEGSGGEGEGSGGRGVRRREVGVRGREAGVGDPPVHPHHIQAVQTTLFLFFNKTKILTPLKSLRASGKTLFRKCQRYKILCFFLIKQNFRNRAIRKIRNAVENLAIKILYICVKQVQNVLK